MTQLVVTLDYGADTSLLRKMIENMKGVLRVSESSPKETEAAHESEWMQRLDAMREKIDPSLIDMDDERTRYIMSK